MITSIVGRLIKKPEPVERITIPGKRLVNFTLVQNTTHGDRRLSVFFNLSVVIATDAQYNLAMRFEKGTVLLFTAPRVTYVRQSEREGGEQSINIYAEAENFKIVAGLDMAPAGAPLPEEEAATARRAAPTAPQARAAGEPEDADSGDPFEEADAPSSPAPARVASKRPASQSTPASQSAPARRPARPDPAPTAEDLSALGDPFAEQPRAG